jgi:para-nitrobenzyl esterase
VNSKQSHISRRRLLHVGAALAGALLMPFGGWRDAHAKSRRSQRDGESTKVVPTTFGRVQGIVSGGIQCFLGIPYGAPPIGENRWMPPQNPGPWTEVLDCSAFGAPAIQLTQGVLPPARSEFDVRLSRLFNSRSEEKVDNEDCLFLNIWTPATERLGLPVIFWIHGGGYAYGSGSQPIYNGVSLARQDVVVVTVNHRLNVFGFLDLSECMGEKYRASGNVGMQDLVLSLMWVRDNIANFGGDPRNVTIVGQSGGGRKVSNLLAMPSAKGLFHKASIQSGAELAIGRKEWSALLANSLLDALKIKAGDSKALEAVSATALTRAANSSLPKALTELARKGASAATLRQVLSAPEFGPTIDGEVITRDPFDPDAPSISADVPLLIGFCKDEMTFFTHAAPWFGGMTEQQLQQRVHTVPRGVELLTAYRSMYPDYSPSYLWSLVLGAETARTAFAVADRKAAQPAPVYMWFMRWETPVEDGKLKSPHSIEIPLVLDNTEAASDFVGSGKKAKQLALQMSDAWVAFSRTGSPQSSRLPHWPQYRSADRFTMVFDSVSKVVADPNLPIRKVLADGDTQG